MARLLWANLDGYTVKPIVPVVMFITEVVSAKGDIDLYVAGQQQRIRHFAKPHLTEIYSRRLAQQRDFGPRRQEIGPHEYNLKTAIIDPSDALQQQTHDLPICASHVNNHRGVTRALRKSNYNCILFADLFFAKVAKH